ncbi:MAG: DUF1585 domain-containing protein, partial [Planctomycetota bacterium]
HDRLDPIGFALEHYDEIGRFRESVGSIEIDVTSSLPDGKVLNGAEGLRTHLLDHREIVMRNLVTKMLGFALARSIDTRDLATIEQIMDRLKANEYRAHELILGIVESDSFRMKMKSS